MMAYCIDSVVLTSSSIVKRTLEVSVCSSSACISLRMPAVSWSLRNKKTLRSAVASMAWHSNSLRIGLEATLLMGATIDSRVFWMWSSTILTVSVVRCVPVLCIAARWPYSVARFLSWPGWKYLMVGQLLAVRKVGFPRWRWPVFKSISLKSISKKLDAGFFAAVSSCMYIFNPVGAGHELLRWL